MPCSRLAAAATAGAALLFAACNGAIGDAPFVEGPGGLPGRTTRTTEPVCLPSAARSVAAEPLRRLTHDELDHVLRDLLRVSGHPSERLDPDERIGPFASNGIAPVSRVTVEQYQTLAEQVAVAVTADIDALVPCDRAALGDDACARELIGDLGLRAMRRPLTPTEQTTYQTLYASYATAGGFANGVRLVVTAMLQSPSFLYKVETPAAGATVASGGATPLDPYALASRLSFFLWSSMPDDELFAAAASGELDTPEGLRAQAERMLESPKAYDGIASFHRQWLGLYKLEGVDRDTTLYPGFGPALVAAMNDEAGSFADYVIRRGDGSLRTLLTAPFTIASDPLATLYGATRPAGASDTDPLPLDPSRRAGVLTQAGVLAAHSHSNQSAPVLRGKLVRENFFCQPLPDPPPGVPMTVALDPEATTRERFTAHRTDPTCSSCHALLDDLGFGLEHYDAIGKYRATENDRDIDATGVLSSTDVDGMFDGAVELAGRLAESREVSDCVARQWFRYALGRFERDADACTLASLEGALEQPDNLRALLFALVTSDAFRYWRQP